MHFYVCRRFQVIDIMHFYGSRGLGGTQYMTLYLRKSSLNNGTGDYLMHYYVHHGNTPRRVYAFLRRSALPDGTSDAFLRASVPPERLSRQKY